jgi:A/G-specific adenine glycosylase
MASHSDSSPAPSHPLHAPVLAWYDRAARDLPWRRSGTSPWGVLVSEVMLQQTPVARALPAYETWMRRWPTPAALAADSPGEPVHAWGRLGYPRRALRLHEAATVITSRHQGEVPEAYDDLRALPGIGVYTAAAVAAFAFGARRAVVDTNVRRVHARAVHGAAQAAATVTATELRLAEDLLPGPQDAPRWAVAVMELGALVCTARAPRCESCPVIDLCAWQRAGRPAYVGPPRRAQRYAGTDRQVRGCLLAVIREAPGPIEPGSLAAAWDEPLQRARALDGLIADGLVEALPDGRYSLPRHAPAHPGDRPVGSGQPCMITAEGCRTVR